MAQPLACVSDSGFGGNEKKTDLAIFLFLLHRQSNMIYGNEADYQLVAFVLNVHVFAKNHTTL